MSVRTYISDMRRAALIGVFSIACAPTMLQQVINDARAQKLVLDAASALISAHLQGRADECAPEIAHGILALDECLGPVASDPEHVDRVFSRAYSAQQLLYRASAAADTNTALVATAELNSAMMDVEMLVQRVRAQERQ